jgi:hypothetical protein
LFSESWKEFKKDHVWEADFAFAGATIRHFLVDGRNKLIFLTEIFLDLGVH